MHEDIQLISASDQGPFSIEMAGISYCDGTYRILRPHAGIAVFEHVIRETGTVIENGRICHPQGGDIYLLHPGCRHEYFADTHNPWTKIWFNAAGPVVEALLQSYALDRINHIPDCPPAAAAIFQTVWRTVRSGLPHAEIVRQCAVLCHSLIALLSDTVRSAGQPDNEAAQLYAYIRTKIAEPVSLDDMARAILRSKSYAVRIFREQYHQTPYACLLSCRIEAARQMLAGTRLSIRAIAEHLVFADQHYFATVFRQFTGLSPKAYRDACQHGQDQASLA